MTLPISICKSDILPFFLPMVQLFLSMQCPYQRHAVVLTLKKLLQSKHMIRNKKKEREDKI